MQDIEKLGLFYLGRTVDGGTGAATSEPLLYDAKDLTTHAVCVGMTGSGKTGLCMALLEEAAIDGIPALIIDPKGDMGNLLLAFPELRSGDFRPWVEAAEAARKGMSADDFAARTAEQWRTGLAQWGQDGARVARYREAVDLAIYTPGSDAGRGLNVLRSFDAPPPPVREDATALRDRVLGAVAGLLGLLGMDADPLQSREHILLATIIDQAWRAGKNLDLAAIIQSVQKPAFGQVGVFDLETFYPAKERLALAMGLNNLLASPGFAVWMQGDPLDVQRLLFTPSGKPRVSIISIAHLSDSERMFVVTLVLNEVLAWMRTQSGTGSLRALLYMDEIFGYFPPIANPPSKLPMLTLLKQARAFGLGVVLATQNPVDLDYKGLANAGTWFIGRLQTERDKARVIEGLEGALAGAGAGFDRAAMEATLAGLGNRVFLMRNVHEEAPVLFQTRWALSYLRGPLTLPQIRTLTKMGVGDEVGGGAPAISPPAGGAQPPTPVATRPVLAVGIAEKFLRVAAASGAPLTYRPSVWGQAKLHFVDAKAGVDCWQDFHTLAPLAPETGEVAWREGQSLGATAPDVESQPVSGASFATLSPGAASAKSTSTWQRTFEEALYQETVLDLWECPLLKVSAKPGESEGDFRARLSLALRERRDAAIEQVRRKFGPRLAVAQGQVQRANERVAREQAQLGHQKLSTAIAFGATLLGAVFGGGRKVSRSSIGGAAATMRGAGRIGREAGDVDRAEGSVEAATQKRAMLEAELEQEIAALQGTFDAGAVQISNRPIRPRKSDIASAAPVLVWVPWVTGADGIPRPAR